MERGQLDHHRALRPPGASGRGPGADSVAGCGVGSGDVGNAGAGRFGTSGVFGNRVRRTQRRALRPNPLLASAGFAGVRGDAGDERFSSDLASAVRTNRAATGALHFLKGRLTQDRAGVAPGGNAAPGRRAARNHRSVCGRARLHRANRQEPGTR